MDQNSLLYIVLAVVLVAMIAFTFRNSRKRRRDQEEMQNKLVPGAEVMTSHGIFGRLVSIDEDKNEAIIETTPGTQLRLHRQTLTRVVDPTEGTASDEVPDDASSLTAADEPKADAPGYELNPESSSTTAAAEPEYGERTDDAGTPKGTPRKKASE